MLKLIGFFLSRLIYLILLFLYRVLLKRSKRFIEFSNVNNEPGVFDLHKRLATCAIKTICFLFFACSSENVPQVEN